MIILNLQFFGEGASAGAASGANTTSSAAGENTGADLSNVVYGIQDTEESEQDTTQTQEEQTPPDLEAEFDALVKGQYKDQYKSSVQKIINQRFANQKNLEKQVASYQPIMDVLAQKYGTEASPEALLKAIEADDSYYEQEAMDSGLTVEQLKTFKRFERENAQLRAYQREQQRQQQSQRIYNEWMQQAEGVKQTYPQFDFETEMSNERFQKLLASGVDVRSAYQAIHFDELAAGFAQASAEKAVENTVNNIRSRNSRPAENGTRSSSGAVVKNDVSKLTKADRSEIIERVRRGEKIRF